MKRLLEGYAHFRSHVFPQNASLFQQLAHGQKPSTLFITCSDSRVMPEMLLQCQPGEIFPIRNAGNFVPAAVETNSGIAGTIEYAVRVLGVRDIVICGHSDCGAMKAILARQDLASLPAVSAWLKHAGPSAQWLTQMLEDSSTLSKDQKLRILTEANVITQMHTLTQHPCIADGLREKTLDIHAWIFEIGDGEVRSYDSERGVFVPLGRDSEDADDLRVA
jgi:carbonic anhydrase